jgi:hypothetical protein
MSKSMAALALTLAGGIGVALAGPALAQTQPAPPSWDTLVKCAEIGDQVDRLACYDRAMKAAGYAPKPEAVSEARHKRFGLPAPHIPALSHKAPKEPKAPKSEQAASGAPEENEGNISVTLAKVGTEATGKLLLITTEGQIWEQTDPDIIVQLPKEGYVMSVHKGPLGGFFCDISKFKSVRCTRIR